MFFVHIRFAAVKVWNNLEEGVKHLPCETFKNEANCQLS